MPNVNLAALSAAELRQTLDASRARGDAALAYEVLREMAARREARAGRARRRTPPHLVSVDLSDPMDRVEEAPEAAAPGPEPLTLRIPDPEPGAAAAEDGDWSLSLRREPPPPRAKRKRGGFGAIGGFALGIACGVGLGWWAAGRFDLPFAPVAADFAAAGPAPRAQPPAPTPNPTSDPAPVEATPAMLQLDVAEAIADAPAQPPAAAEPAPQAAAEPLAEPLPQPLSEVAGACAAEATPADRTICGDPTLQALQRDLRQAYAEALDAHQDKATLRQRQLTWRDARNEVADAATLASIYRERIDRLRSATTAARTRR